MGDSDQASKHRIERRYRHARETLGVLRKLLASQGRDPETAATLHEIHAQHERELGHHANAERAEERARDAKRRSQR